MVMAAGQIDIVQTKLELARRELLELGLRNPLLNYRTLRARGVEVVGANAPAVFRSLVVDKKALSFLAGQDADTEGLLDQHGDAEAQRSTRQRDLRLQTVLTSSQLQARLLATHHAARLFIEEQGVNILYMALGMLTWFEADNSETVRRAPLLLIPVEMERSNVRERFQLRYTEEDVEANLSLHAKLRAEFALTLPSLPEIEDLDVELYMAQIDVAIRSQARWFIDCNSALLGFFSFGKFLMYRDLDVATWPDGASPAAHPLIQALMGNGLREPAPRIGDDDQIDRHILPMQFNEVVNADSTQMLAIFDVSNGRNLVIQGPPGTGKSQTITNLIASAIGRGQTVLFMAEKMAALEVVKRRLDSVGLGDACLELHSFKTQKKAVLAELVRTLDLGRPRIVRQGNESALLNDVQNRINAYFEALSAPIGDSGVTPYEALGRLTVLRQRHGSLPDTRLDLPSMDTWTSHEYETRRELIDELQAQLAMIGVPKDHPFWGSQRTRLLPAEQDQLRDALRAALASTSELRAASETFAQMLGLPLPTTFAETKPLLRSWWLRWRFLFGTDRAARRRLREAATAQREHARRVVELLVLDEALRFGSQVSLEAQDFTVQQQHLSRWADHLPDLRSWSAGVRLFERCREAGLDVFVKLVEEWPAAGTDLVMAFTSSWFESLLARAYRERSALAQFDGNSHQHATQRFCSLDRLALEHNRAQLAHAHWSRLPQSTGSEGGQLGVLRREFEKKIRHLPVRQLITRAGRAIQAIKPVFMMSPLSVASYLAPDSVRFDLVIFDEASQVRPVDALGAIARAKQVVVVGDSRQMPPTSFFDSLTSIDNDEDSPTADIESILGLFIAQGAPQRMLRWHYRSRHESLIALSNQEFYDSRLVVFPSPEHGGEALGLKYHHLADTSYDRGVSRTNQLEARAVAEAVMVHARDKPHLTLGVAAFSVAQMQAILDHLEIMRRQDSSCEAFFAAHAHEPFFVKNLENVQGDERDVIFISIGYGRTAEGYVAMEFGPLNRDGGERRLNVLITRARLRCEVFTNLTANDIDLERSQARGVRVLKAFLGYAQNGILDVPRVTGHGFDSPFEEAVYDALTAAGFQVRAQIGSGGFLLDLAIVDPHQPGRYLLGIECDGAAYHSSRSARDRDRLRQEVLEGLGWRIHRIWSTDWFRAPEREMDRLKAAIAAVSVGSVRQHESEAQPRPLPPVERESAEQPIERSIMAEPYSLAPVQVNTRGKDLHMVAVTQLADWVVKVVEVESPVHVSEVARRIADAAGFKRIGNRMQGAIDAASAHAVRTGAIRRQGNFLWLKTMQLPPVRDRSLLPVTTRKIDLIAPEEIARAVLMVIVEAYGMEREQVAGATCRLLGFGRLNDDIRVQIEAAVNRLIALQGLADQSGHLVLNGS